MFVAPQLLHNILAWGASAAAAAVSEAACGGGDAPFRREAAMPGLAPPFASKGAAACGGRSPSDAMDGMRICRLATAAAASLPFHFEVSMAAS